MLREDEYRDLVGKLEPWELRNAIALFSRSFPFVIGSIPDFATAFPFRIDFVLHVGFLTPKTLATGQHLRFTLLSIPAMATFEMQPTKGFIHDAMPAPDSSVHADDRVRVDASGVATGTEADAFDMARMGRSQELRRNFKSLSIFGLAITTMSTPIALLLSMPFLLINGGLAGSVWVYLASWICTFTLAASLAEMSSMAPTSGGQYREFAVLG